MRTRSNSRSGRSSIFDFLARLPFSSPTPPCRSLVLFSPSARVSRTDEVTPVMCTVRPIDRTAAAARTRPRCPPGARTPPFTRPPKCVARAAGATMGRKHGTAARNVSTRHANTRNSSTTRARNHIVRRAARRWASVAFGVGRASRASPPSSGCNRLAASSPRPLSLVRPINTTPRHLITYAP